MESCVKNAIEIFQLYEEMAEERLERQIAIRQRIKKGLAQTPNLSFWQDPVVWLWRSILIARKNSLSEKVAYEKAKLLQYICAENALEYEDYSPAIELLGKILEETPPRFHGIPAMNIDNNSVSNVVFYDLAGLMKELIELQEKVGTGSLRYSD